MSLADTISTASSFAARSGDEVDGQAEMIGIGAANLAAGLFQGFPVSTSGSRTAVAERAGAKTQVTGLVGAVAIVLILLFFPGLLRNLPQPTLAAVVIAASLSLADIPETLRLRQIRHTEFAQHGRLPRRRAAGRTAGDRAGGGPVDRQRLPPGVVAVPDDLGQVPGLDGYHDVTSYPHARLMPGCVIFRFDAPLFFANSRTFREQIRSIAATEPRPTWIIVAAEPITDVDTTAADMLRELDEELNARGTHLVFAEMKDPVRAKIDRYGLTNTIDPRHFFPTVTQALKAYQSETGAEWQQPSS